MRISDWSSDVCSSDLIVHFLNVLIARRLRRRMVRSTKPYPVSGAFLAHYVRGAFPVLSDEAIGRDHLGISKSRLSNLLNGVRPAGPPNLTRSEEHTSELQSLMRIPNAVFCLKKKK